jgi:hypothetical protein
MLIKRAEPFLHNITTHPCVTPGSINCPQAYDFRSSGTTTSWISVWRPQHCSSEPLRSGTTTAPLTIYTACLWRFFPPFSHWIVFPSMPSKSHILEEVATSRNCNTTGLGTWDIGFWLGRISVHSLLFDHGSYVNAPTSLFSFTKVCI